MFGGGSTASSIRENYFCLLSLSHLAPTKPWSRSLILARLAQALGFLGSAPCGGEMDPDEEDAAIVRGLPEGGGGGGGVGGKTYKHVLPRLDPDSFQAHVSDNPLHLSKQEITGEQQRVQSSPVARGRPPKSSCGSPQPHARQILVTAPGPRRELQERCPQLVQRHEKCQQD